MALQNLSSNAQDYLKVIWDLYEWGNHAVQPSDLANKAGVKPSTVSGAVAKLVEGGFVIHNPYGAIELTPLGTRYALMMVRKHRLLETFLVETLKYGWDEVHNEADALEHAASDLMISRIDDALNHPLTDPHGDPIPQADGTMPELSSIPLSQARAGAIVQIDRVNDDDPELLRYLHEHAVCIGSTALIGSKGPYSDSITLIVQSPASRSSQRFARVVQNSAELPSVTLNEAASSQIRVSILNPATAQQS